MARPLRAAVTVLRYDAARLGRTSKTPQGFLRAPARVTRTGVLTYRRADGSVVRELRRPEQVFAAHSLDTLADAPITDLHPSAMVNPTNAKQLAVGHVAGRAQADGTKFVEAELLITDAAMIAAVERKDRSELSCGYTCDLLERPGVWNGQHYDAEQTNIIYNHVGLGPANWGRAGSEVALRLDGKTDTALGNGAARAELDADSDIDEPKGRVMDLVTVRLDGLEAQVAPNAAQLIQRALETRDAAATAATTKLADTTKRLDTLQAQLDVAKRELTEATAPERFDAAVTARIQLLELARPILGAEYAYTGKTSRQIKQDALAKLNVIPDLASRTDSYLDAAFDLEAPKHRTQHGDPSPVDQLRQHIAPPPNNRADAEDVFAILDGRVQQQQQPRKYEPPAWRQQLGTHNR